MKNKKSSSQDIKSVADVIEDEEKIYTKFLLSEDIRIEENSIYEFETANELIEILTDLHFAKKESDPNYHREYYKISFELHYNKECTDKFYTGRMYVEDGDVRNLREHIYRFVEDGNFINISEDTKKWIFDTLKINNNKDFIKDKSLSI